MDGCISVCYNKLELILDRDERSIKPGIACFPRKFF